MKIEHSFTLPAPVDRVMAMVADADYVADKIRRTGALDHTVEVTTDGPGPVIRTTRLMSTEQLPQVARRAVGERVTLIEEQTWQAPAADGSRSGQLKVGAGRAPVSLTATLHLEPRGEETVFSTVGDLTVSIPFLGPQLEKQAEPLVGQVVGIEEQASREWLANH